MLYPFLLSTSYYVYQRPFLLNIYLKYLFICHLNFPSTCNLSNSFSLIVHVSEECHVALQATALIIFFFNFLSIVCVNSSLPLLMASFVIPIRVFISTLYLSYILNIRIFLLVPHFPLLLKGLVQNGQKWSEHLSSNVINSTICKHITTSANISGDSLLLSPRATNVLYLFTVMSYSI